MARMDNGKTMTPRYLITGTAGFIGSRVAELLLDGGAEVTGVDNLNHAYDVRLKEWRLAQLDTREGFSFRRVDISDPRAVDGLFAKGFDAVVNLAARAGVRASVEDPQAYIDCNVSGTLNLLRACKTYDVPKLVQASSSSVYGSRTTPPYREDAVTDWPLSPYAASKKACEVLCYPYHHLNGTDVTACRFFTVYGPAGRPDMVLFRVVQWIAEGRPVIICGDGRQERNFSYLDDVARGVVAGLKRVGFEVVNLWLRQVGETDRRHRAGRKAAGQEGENRVSARRSGGRVLQSCRRRQSKESARLGAASGFGRRSRQDSGLVPGKSRMGQGPGHAVKDIWG